MHVMLPLMTIGLPSSNALDMAENRVNGEKISLWMFCINTGGFFEKEKKRYCRGLSVRWLVGDAIKHFSYFGANMDSANMHRISNLLQLMLFCHLISQFVEIQLR